MATMQEIKDNRARELGTLNQQARALVLLRSALAALQRADVEIDRCRSLLTGRDQKIALAESQALRAVVKDIRRQITLAG